MLIAAGVYFLPSFEKITQRPEYEGDNQEDVEFMRCSS